MRRHDGSKQPVWDLCGTSAATPVVAGIAGLAFSAVPTATNAQVGQASENTPVPLSITVPFTEACQFVVAGSGFKGSAQFTLTVTYTMP